MPIRVLIVDDSAAMRAMLAELLDAAPDIEVVGMAADPIEARERIKALDPDVVTLDVEMPRMDGIDFLGRLMRLRPTPVVMISSHTLAGSEATLRALELGAVDFLGKPRAASAGALAAYREELREKIRTAHGARRNIGKPACAKPPAPPRSVRCAPDALVLIGASTGGTEAIKAVLDGLPESTPPVLMVQHMPELFTGSFARRLDASSRLKVKEAEHGEPLAAGHAYLAPGHSHLRVKRQGGTFRAELDAGPLVNRHRPAVNVLFESAAGVAGRSSVAVLLTGMGRDGAQGLRALRDAGLHTIAQDEASCVVYGMPRAAVEIDAAAEIAALPEIAARILRGLERRS